MRLPEHMGCFVMSCKVLIHKMCDIALVVFIAKGKRAMKIRTINKTAFITP